MARGMDDTDASAASDSNAGCVIFLLFVLAVVALIYYLSFVWEPARTCPDYKRYCEVRVDNTICLYDDQLNKLKTDSCREVEAQ